MLGIVQKLLRKTTTAPALSVKKFMYFADWKKQKISLIQFRTGDLDFLSADLYRQQQDYPRFDRLIISDYHGRPRC